MKLTISQENIDRTIDNNERFPVGSIRDETGGQAEKSPAPDIQKLVDQILGQGTTSKWSGEGYGSNQANAREMAKMLAGIGITDINQFGKFKQVASYAGQAPSTVYPNDPADPSKGYYTFEHVWDASKPAGEEVVRSENKIPVDPSTISNQGYDVYDEAIGEFVRVDRFMTNTPVYEEVLGNKETKQPISSDYDQRYGNIFGGTYAGKDSTGFGVQFRADGTPVFYTQAGNSTSDVGHIMPIVSFALSAFAPGLGGAIGAALTGTAATTVISQVVGSAIIQGTMAELSGGNFADGAIKGAVGAGVAPLVAGTIGKTVADAMGNAEYAKVVTNAVTSASSAAVTTALLGGDVGDAALNAAVSSIGSTVGKELGGDAGAKLGAAVGQIAMGADAQKVLTSTLMSTLTSSVQKALKDDPLLAASSKEIGQGEVDAIRKHTEDAAANLNVAGTGDAATDQEIADIVAGSVNAPNLTAGETANTDNKPANFNDGFYANLNKGNVAIDFDTGLPIEDNLTGSTYTPENIGSENIENILLGGSGDSFAGPSGLTPKYVEAMPQMQPRDGEVAEDVIGELQDDGTTVYSRRITKTLPDGTKVGYTAIYDPILPGTPYRYEYSSQNDEGTTISAAKSRPDFGINAGVSTDTSLPTDKKSDEQPVDNILKTGNQSAQDDLEAQAIISGFPDYYTMEQYNGNVEDYLRDVEASKPVDKEPAAKEVVETPAEVTPAEIAAPKAAPPPEFFERPTQQITQAPPPQRQTDIPPPAPPVETEPEKPLPPPPPPNVETEEERNERLEAEAALLGFPSYAVMQQYNGDVNAYNQDVADQAEIKRLADIETKRLADAETKRLADAETKRLEDIETKRLADIETKRVADVEEARQSAARNAGFPDAATFDDYAGDVYAYQSALERKDFEQKQAEAEVLGFPDYATLQKYNGDISKYKQDLADAEEAKRLADEEDERKRAADQKILDDAEFKRLADEAEVKRQSDARAAGFPDADTFDTYDGNIDAYNKYLYDEETKRLATIESNRQASARLAGFPDANTSDDFGGDIDAYNKSLQVGDTKLLDDDGLLKLTPTEGENRGLITSVLVGEDSLAGTGGDTLKAGTGDDTLDGLLDLTSTTGDDRGAITPVIVENGLGEVVSVVVGDDSLKAETGDDTLLDLTATEVDPLTVTPVIVEDGLGQVVPVIVEPEPCPEGKVRNLTTGLCETPVVDDDPPFPPDCPEGKVRNLGTGECEDVVKPVITTVKPDPDPVTTKPKPNPALDALLAGLATPQSVGEDKTEPFYGKMGPYMDIGADFDFLKPLGFDPKDALKRQQMNKMAVGGFIDALQAEEMTVDDLLSFLQQRN